MATTLQIVDETDLTTVLFDFNDPTGANNGPAGGVRTDLAVGGGLGLGVGQFEPVVLSPPALDGGSVVSSRYGLGTASWLQRIRPPSAASTPDLLISGVGYLGHLLGQGGVIKYVPNNSAEVRYIDFEPSATPALYQGTELELLRITSQLDTPEGVQLQVLRQPFLRGAELSPSLNLVGNATLTEDFGGTANRPDGWTWTGTTGLTAETITTNLLGPRRGVYQFSKADAAAASLQYTTADNTYASGDVGVFSFYARVVSGSSCQMQATLQFQTNAAANVGGLHSGGLVSLTSAWQRISVTSTAAGATTGQALVSIQIDDTDANPNVVQVCNAQAEKTSLTAFRVPSSVVSYNPASTALPRRVAVWAEGNAPSRAKLRATADSLTMGRYRVYRVSEKAVDILKATLHKSLRSGTLGADTTSTADGDGLDGNVAAVAYSEPDPAFGTDTTGTASAPTTVTVTAPASLAVGDAMVVLIAGARTVGSATNLQIGSPKGWRFLGSQLLLGVLFAWVKIADAADVAAGSFDFPVLLAPGVGTLETAAWCGRFTNVDQNDPVDGFAFATETGSTTTPTAASISTSANNAEIITAYFCANAPGAQSFTAPTGTTPTYTEQADFQLPTTSKALGVYTGVLATAGATGTKDATAASSGDNYVMLNMALNKAKASLAPRSTVTFSGTGTGALPAGEYDLFLRYRTTAACQDRIRVEYALRASPTVYIALPDFILETRGATSFSEYEEHLMGRIAVPSDQPLDTLTVRVSSGREVTSSANLRLDAVILAPVFETASMLSSDVVLANGEHFLTYPDVGGAYHLASDSDQSDPATVDGPTPVELAPGYNVLVAWPAVLPLAGYVDPATEVTSAPTLSVTHAPRYRT